MPPNPPMWWRCRAALIAVAVASVAGVLAPEARSLRLPEGLAGAKTMTPEQLWGFEVTGASLSQLGRKRLALLRAHGVNALVVDRRRISITKLAALEKRAAKWQMNVVVALPPGEPASLRLDATCQVVPNQPAATTCARMATSGRMAASLVVDQAADVVVMRVGGPVDTFKLGLDPSGWGVRLLMLPPLPSKDFPRALWKAAISNALQQPGLDLAVSAMGKARVRSLSSYLRLLPPTRTHPAGGAPPPTGTSPGGTTGPTGPVGPPTTPTGPTSPASPPAPQPTAPQPTPPATPTPVVPGEPPAPAPPTPSTPVPPAPSPAPSPAPPSPGGTPVGTVFVTPGGSDSDASVCKRYAAPPASYPGRGCATFNVAYSVARPGDTVQVCGGTYGPQQIVRGSQAQAGPTITFKNCAGQRPTVSLPSGRALQLGQNNGSASGNAPSYITFDGIDVNGAVGLIAAPNSGQTPATGIVFKNLHIWSIQGACCGELLIGNHSVTVDNVEIGPECCNSDGILIGLGVGQPNPNNITIKNSYIHDLYSTCTKVPAAIKSSYGGCSGSGFEDPGGGGLEHIDGIQLIGGSNITIEGNRFERAAALGCGGVLFSAPVNGGSFSNWTIQNNFFGRTACTNDAINLAGPGIATYSGYFNFLNNTVEGFAQLHGNSTERIFVPSAKITFTGNRIGSFKTSGPTNCTVTASDGTELRPTYVNNVFGSIGGVAGTTCNTSG